ncbi:MAG: hypothetical protein AB8U25_02090 [Rickettsiales endosymbiont of Dermacentor nuttalli]
MLDSSDNNENKDTNVENASVGKTLDNLLDKLYIDRKEFVEKAEKFALENVPESVKKLMDQAKEMGMSALAFKETFGKYLNSADDNTDKNIQSSSNNNESKDNNTQS